MSSSSSTADAAPHPARGDDGELYLFEIAMAPAAFAGHWTGSWEPCRDAGANGGIVDVHAPSEPMDVITEKSQRGVRHFYGVMPHLLRLRQYHNVRGGEIELAAKLVEGAQAWITLPASGDSYVEISPGGVGDRRSTVFFPNELDRSAEKVDNGKLLRAVASLAARRREEMGAGMSAAAPAASVKGSARKKQKTTRENETPLAMRIQAATYYRQERAKQLEKRPGMKRMQQGSLQKIKERVEGLVRFKGETIALRTLQHDIKEGLTEDTSVAYAVRGNSSFVSILPATLEMNALKVVLALEQRGEMGAGLEEARLAVAFMIKGTPYEKKFAQRKKTKPKPGELVVPSVQWGLDFFNRMKKAQPRLCHMWSDPKSAISMRSFTTANVNAQFDGYKKFLVDVGFADINPLWTPSSGPDVAEIVWHPGKEERNSVTDETGVGSRGDATPAPKKRLVLGPPVPLALASAAIASKRKSKAAARPTTSIKDDNVLATFVAGFNFKGEHFPPVTVPPRKRTDKKLVDAMQESALGSDDMGTWLGKPYTPPRGRFIVSDHGNIKKKNFGVFIDIFADSYQGTLSRDNGGAHESVWVPPPLPPPGAAAAAAAPPPPPPPPAAGGQRKRKRRGSAETAALTAVDAAAAANAAASAAAVWAQLQAESAPLLGEFFPPVNCILFTDSHDSRSQNPSTLRHAMRRGVAILASCVPNCSRKGQGPDVEYFGPAKSNLGKRKREESRPKTWGGLGIKKRNWKDNVRSFHLSLATVSLERRLSALRRTGMRPFTRYPLLNDPDIKIGDAIQRAELLVIARRKATAAAEAAVAVVPVEAAALSSSSASSSSSSSAAAATSSSISSSVAGAMSFSPSSVGSTVGGEVLSHAPPSALQVWGGDVGSTETPPCLEGLEERIKQSLSRANKDFGPSLGEAAREGAARREMVAIDEVLGNLDVIAKKLRAARAVMVGRQSVAFEPIPHVRMSPADRLVHGNAEESLASAQPQKKTGERKNGIFAMWKLGNGIYTNPLVILQLEKGDAERAEKVAHAAAKRAVAAAKQKKGDDTALASLRPWIDDQALSSADRNQSIKPPGMAVCSRFLRMWRDRFAKTDPEFALGKVAAEGDGSAVGKARMRVLTLWPRMFPS